VDFSFGNQEKKNSSDFDSGNLGRGECLVLFPGLSSRLPIGHLVVRVGVWGGGGGGGGIWGGN